jgi:hypothetical protein
MKSSLPFFALKKQKKAAVTFRLQQPCLQFLALHRFTQSRFAGYKTAEKK